MKHEVRVNVQGGFAQCTMLFSFCSLPSALCTLQIVKELEEFKDFKSAG